jgi:hypothetical protein
MEKQISPVMSLLLKLRPIQTFVREANRMRELEHAEIVRQVFGYHRNDD